MADPLAVCQLRQPGAEHLYDQVFANHRGAVATCEPMSRLGKRLALCGAGPSLHDYRPGTHDEVWAVNSALPFLMQRGDRVTHGLTIDHTDAMLDPHEWAETFDVEYLVASSIHPRLTAHLTAAGRRLRWFHNFLGTPEPADWAGRDGFSCYEDWLYRKLYPTTLVAGAGLNGVPRALSLALGMGFEAIDVYGADCGTVIPALCGAYPGLPGWAEWLDTIVLYADGRTMRWYGDAESPATALIDGVLWASRPDMLISCMHLLALRKDHPGCITYHGLTLPGVLQDKPDEFLAGMPRLNAEKAQVTNVRVTLRMETATT